MILIFYSMILNLKTMTKKMLLLVLLPACPAFAQEAHVHEEDTPPPVVSVLTREIEDTRMQLVSDHDRAPFVQTFHFSSIADQGKLRISQDYHDPEELLKAPSQNSSGEVTIKHFANAKLSLEGITYDQLDCYQIHDQYRVRAGHELPGDFVYNNTYFVYRDRTGATLAQVIYVECSIGNTTTEKRIVRKGARAFATGELIVSPNPAQKNISVDFTTAEKGIHTISVVSADGKVVSTLLDRQALEAGRHSFAYNLDLPSGVYILSLNSGKAAPITQKLIIK